MRIEDTGRYECRKGQYAETADVLGEATKSKGIDQVTPFTIEMIDNLDRVKDHPDMTRELAEEFRPKPYGSRSRAVSRSAKRRSS